VRFAVGSWNMNQQDSSWAYLRTLGSDHGVQVALLQEAAHPKATNAIESEPRADEREAWLLPVPPVARRNYCSAVVALDAGLHLEPRRPTPLALAKYGKFAISHPGQFAVADVPVADITLTVVSLYGIWDRMHDSGDLYAEATLHRAISDLTTVFQEREVQNIVVAGDLNVWHDYPRKPWNPRFASVFDRLAAYDLDLIGPFRREGAAPLEGCPCKSPDCRHVNTYRHHRKPAAVPYQNDFMFATAALRERLNDCYAVEDEDVWRHSDHRPIVGVFDL